MKARILKSGVGEITESDIQAAVTSDACLVAFGVKIPGKTMTEIQKHRIPIFQSNIIYDIIDKAEAHLASLLKFVHFL